MHPKPCSAFGNSSGIPAAHELCLLDIMICVSHNIKLLVAAWSGLANATAPTAWVKCTALFAKSISVEVQPKQGVHSEVYSCSE